MEDFGFFNQFVIHNPMNDQLTTLEDFWKYLEEYVREHERYRDCFYAARHSNILLDRNKDMIKILDPIIDEYIPFEVFKNNYISYHTCYDDLRVENNNLKSENEELKKDIKAIEAYIKDCLINKCKEVLGD